MQEIEEKKPMPRQDGIHIGRVYFVIVAVAVVLSIALLFFSLQMNNCSGNVSNVMRRYTSCLQDAEKFEAGLDYLSEEARLFVVTGDEAHVKNYVEELEVTCRRELIMRNGDFHAVKVGSFSCFLVAYDYSFAQIQTESYAMRLMIASLGRNASDFPERIGGIELTEQDTALTPDAQRAAALDMLFGSEYSETRSVIHDQVEQGIAALVKGAREETADNAKQASGLFLRELLLIVLLLGLVIAVVVITSLLILHPLSRGIHLLEEWEEMPVTGTYEMRHFAQAYNDVLTKNNERHEKLSYSANHDAVTGLYNRRAYEKAYKALHNSKVCLLEIDINGFKQFNDTYGHDVGDLVLKRVARVLSDSFRSEDHISRIGGDEFCVIMRNADSSLTDLVRSKVERMNNTLSIPEDGTPSITVSVGVAFCDRKNPKGDLFKDADTALYRAKNSEEEECVIYE